MRCRCVGCCDSVGRPVARFFLRVAGLMVCWVVTFWALGGLVV